MHEKLIFVIGNNLVGKTQYIYYNFLRDRKAFPFQVNVKSFLLQGLSLPIKSNKAIYLNYPEHGIDPVNQLNLGSYLVDCVKEGNSFIVETHSEDAILRVRKLVAQGKFDPDLVKIVYVYKEGDDIVSKNIWIEQDGSLTRGLPMSHFGCDVIEALGIIPTKWKQGASERIEIE